MLNNEEKTIDNILARVDAVDDICE